MTPPKIHPITDIWLPKAEMHHIAGGMQFCCVRGGEAEVVRLRIVWYGGEMDCRLPQVARITSLLLPEATKSYPNGEVARILDFNGAKLNISTTHHNTVLTLTTLTSKLGKVLPVVADIIKNPCLDEHTFELMREITAMRLATSLADVDTCASLMLNNVMRGSDHPNSMAVTPDMVRNIELEEVKKFYRDTVRCASSAIALVSGNFSDSELREVKKMLTAMPDDGGAAFPLVPFVPDHAGIYIKPVDDALQAGIHIGLPVPPAESKEGVDVRNTIYALGGYFGSRLMQNIREDKGYTYGIQAYMLNNIEGASMRISVQTDVSLVDAVIEETRKEMLLLAENPPVGEELDRLRQSLALELAAVVDTPFSVADEYMRQLTGLVPSDFFARRIASLASLSPEIIARTAATYLRPEHLRIALAK